MEWTKEKPTKQGWYWCYKDGTVGIAYVCDSGVTMLECKPTHSILRTNAEVEEWAGPIPEPYEE